MGEENLHIRSPLIDRLNSKFVNSHLRCSEAHLKTFEVKSTSQPTLKLLK